MSFSVCTLQRAHGLSTLAGYSGYGAEQGEKVCGMWSLYISVISSRFFLLSSSSKACLILGEKRETSSIALFFQMKNRSLYSNKEILTIFAGPV